MEAPNIMYFFPFPDALHNSSNSPGNATSTTAYGPIYNPAAPPPSTENYLGGGLGLGDHESQHALRLAGSGKEAALATESCREFSRVLRGVFSDIAPDPR